MNVLKGEKEYLATLKKREFNSCLAQWGAVFLIIGIGLLIFRSFLNICSILAIIGTLPAIKTTVAVMVKKEFHPMVEEKAQKLKEYEEYLSVIYNPIICSRDKIMAVESMVILNNTVLMYVSNEATDEGYTTRFVRTILTIRKMEKPNIKVYTDYKMFIDRVDGLYNMAQISNTKKSELEAKIELVILSYCM